MFSVSGSICVIKGAFTFLKKQGRQAVEEGIKNLVGREKGLKQVMNGRNGFGSSIKMWSEQELMKIQAGGL